MFFKTAIRGWTNQRRSQSGAVLRIDSLKEARLALRTTTPGATGRRSSEAEQMLDPNSRHLTFHLSSRPSPPRRTHSNSHFHHPNSGFPPRPPLLPTPPPPPHRPYCWGAGGGAPPAPESNWRRPNRSDDVRPRYQRSERHRSPPSRRQEGRRRSPPRPPRLRPPPPPPVQPYTPRWSNQSDFPDVGMWDGSQRSYGQGHSDYRYHSRDNV